MAAADGFRRTVGKMYCILVPGLGQEWVAISYVGGDQRARFKSPDPIRAAEGIGR